MSLSPQTYRRDVRSALSTFLGKYFNGAAHTVNNPATGTGASVTFRTCTLAFQRPEMGAALSAPLIVVEHVGEAQLGRFATKTGVRIVEAQTFRFIVFTTDVDKHWDVNDNVQDLLETLLNGAAGELGLTGLHLVRVNRSTAWPGDPSEEFQISQRIVVFSVDMAFGGVS